MTTVQHRASLHEGAVQKVAREEISMPRRGRGPTRTRRVLDSRDTKVDPLIWRLVRENRIDHLRVEVISDRDVVIWNHRRPWPLVVTLVQGDD